MDIELARKVKGKSKKTLICPMHPSAKLKDYQVTEKDGTVKKGKCCSKCFTTSLTFRDTGVGGVYTNKV